MRSLAGYWLRRRSSDGPIGLGAHALYSDVLVPTVALMATAWALLLMPAACLSRIRAHAASFLGVGLVVAAISGSGLVLTMAWRRDGTWA